MMSTVDSISSVVMDTPIALIFMFADVIEFAAELEIVLGDIGDDFIAAESDIKSS
jgi:hypothetical protein